MSGKLKLLTWFVCFIALVPTDLIGQQAPVDLGSDLPWLRNNNTGFQPSYNVSRPRNADGTKKIDPQLPAFTDEMQYLNQPSNNLPFLVDRTLDRNYIDKQYAVLKVLDKVTSKISTVKARVGSTVKFGWIDINVKLAKKTPPEEEPEATTFIEVTTDKFMTKEEGDREKVFSGFIFASSPSISGLEHPRYDIRLFDALNEDELEPKVQEASAKEGEGDKAKEASQKNTKKEEQKKAA